MHKILYAYTQHFFLCKVDTIFYANEISTSDVHDTTTMTLYNNQTAIMTSQ
jgi:hypothetical protein